MKYCAIVLLSLMACNQAASNHGDYYTGHQTRYNNNYNKNSNNNNYHQRAASHVPTNRYSGNTYSQERTYHQPTVQHSSRDQEARTLHNDQEINPDGSYSYGFETSNGIAASQHSSAAGVVQGTSSYISPEGIEIKMSYVADENGFHPVGDHIPKTPDYILRALEYIKNHPYQERDYYSGITKQANIAPKVQIYTQNSNAVVPSYKTTSRPYNNNNHYKTTSQPPIYYSTATNNYRPPARSNVRYFRY